MTDHIARELSELARLAGQVRRARESRTSPPRPRRGDDGDDSRMTGTGLQQMWAIYGGRRYSACETAVDELVPGQYTIEANDSLGIHFHKADINLDELIRLPDSVSDEIVREIRTFWTKEEHFRKFGFLWKRGVLLWGPPGSGKSLKRGTPVIMYDGSIKAVEDIKVGDLVMGDDSTPRTVCALGRGREKMYRIDQTNGDSYTVNESHILSLVRSTWKKGRHNPHRRTTEYKDVELKDYLATTANFQKEWYGYKVSIEFQAKPTGVDPYYLGLWLGDGTSANTDITTADGEVIGFLESYATNVGLRLVEKKISPTNKAKTYALSGKAFQRGSNPLRAQMKQLGVLNNKHIPQLYKINSRETRLQLLAGLLDSDGYLGSNCFEFSNTNKRLIDDVVFLVRSLGFRVSVSQKQTTNQTGDVFYSQSVHISGHTDQIPTRIKRKQAKPRKQIKDPLHTSIEVIPLDEDDYYGFTLDGNGRFLLGDFTVTHNTSTLQQISNEVIENGGISVYVSNPDLSAKGLKILRQVEPTRPLVVMLEDIDTIIDDHGEADLLALMDGELQIDNVVFVATTNFPERLDQRFVCRPSRFDLVRKIGMPNEEARRVYLTAKNKRLSENHAELQKWIKATKNFSIAHIKELIVSIEVFEVEFEAAVARLRALIDNQPKSSDNQIKGSFGFVND